MVVGRILTALTLLVSMPLPSLGSPGSRDPLNGTVLVDTGAAEASPLQPETSTLQPETAEGPGSGVFGAGPSGSGWPGDSHLAAMLNSALVRPLL